MEISCKIRPLSNLATITFKKDKVVIFKKYSWNPYEGNIVELSLEEFEELRKMKGLHEENSINPN